MLSIFSLFRASLGREMSNGEKACQLIYQLAARVQLYAIRAERLRLWGRGLGTESLAVCLSVMVLLAMWTLGDRVKMNEWPVFTVKRVGSVDITYWSG